MKNVTIYTKTSCPYCVKAKQLFMKLNVNYDEKILGMNGISKQDIQKQIDAVNPSYGAVKTVPQIFIDGKHIGGYTELVEFTK